MIAVLGPLPSLLFATPERLDCDDCPQSVLFLEDNGTLYTIFDVLTSLIAVVLVGYVVFVTARALPRRAAGPPARDGAGDLVRRGPARRAGRRAPDRGGRRPGGDLATRPTSWGCSCSRSCPTAFVFGVLRSRVLQAGAVTEFLHRIGDGPDPSDLRDLLSTALGDRSLQVVYWLDRPRKWVDAAGHPAVLPGEDDPARAVTRVEREGRAVGALIHDRSLCEDPELVGSVAAAAGLSIENERLQAQLRARVEELRASRARIVAAGTAERRRLERNLHDGAQQRLVALSLTLRVAQSRLRKDPDGAEAMIAGAQEELTLALEELRELARGIHPAVLSDRGLEPALAALAGRSPVPVEVEETPAERLPPAVEAAAYFVVAEALTNVVKYAGPRRRGSRSRARTDTPSWRSPTTASAAPIRPADRGCAASPTGSPPSTERSSCGHRRARGPCFVLRSLYERPDPRRHRRRLRTPARGSRAPARGVRLRGRRAGR